MACAGRADVHRRALAVTAAISWLHPLRVSKRSTRLSDAGGGSTDEVVIRRCWASRMDSGEGLGEERAFRLAMLEGREVVEEVLRECDIVLHCERGLFWCLLAVSDDEHDVGEAGWRVEIGVRVYVWREKYLPK